FQAEDGIRDLIVTGVQTCALPILMILAVEFRDRLPWLSGISTGLAALVKVFPAFLLAYFAVTRRWRALFWSLGAVVLLLLVGVRSEERRVGKEGRCGWSRCDVWEK